MKFLERSSSIRGELQKLFRRSRNRKVILVAFVGEDAPRLLPCWEGVELYCWPKAGGTNPKALEHLKKLGAIIHFVDRMHMKLYWVGGRGAVIGSANLTDNALGDGKLHEAAVLLRRPDLVDVDKIIAQSKPEPMTIAALRRLTEEHHRFYRRVEFSPAKKRRSTKPSSFLDWYRNRIEDWWLVWWECGGEAADSVLDQLEAEEGTRGYYDYMDFGESDCPGKDKWLLTYKIGRDGLIGKPAWMYIDHAYRVSGAEADETDYPVQAIQQKPLTTTPPFDLNEAGFMSVFCQVVGDHPVWGKKRKTSVRKWLPSEDLLKKLAEVLSNQT